MQKKKKTLGETLGRKGTTSKTCSPPEAGTEQKTKSS